MGCERVIFGGVEASLKRGLELINPGPAVDVNTANQQGGGSELSFPLLLCFSLCLCLLDTYKNKNHEHSDTCPHVFFRALSFDFELETFSFSPF